MKSSALLIALSALALPGAAIAANLPVGSPPPLSNPPSVWVSSSKAMPTKISQAMSRETGIPGCTKLPYRLHTATPRRVIIVVHKLGSASFQPITLIRQKSGKHAARWCGQTGVRDYVGSYTWFPCVGPTNLHRQRNQITCKARAPKRWITVVP